MPTADARPAPGDGESRRRPVRSAPAAAPSAGGTRLSKRTRRPDRPPGTEPLGPNPWHSGPNPRRLPAAEARPGGGAGAARTRPFPRSARRGTRLAQGGRGRPGPAGVPRERAGEETRRPGSRGLRLLQRHVRHKHRTRNRLSANPPPQTPLCC